MKHKTIEEYWGEAKEGMFEDETEEQLRFEKACFVLGTKAMLLEIEGLLSEKLSPFQLFTEGVKRIKAYIEEVNEIARKANSFLN